MNPQYSDAPGLHLPQPASMPIPPTAGYATPPSAAVIPISPVAQVSPAPSASPLPLASTPSGLEDGSAVMDEEWVGKARDIVAQYSTDPFVQSRELGKVKAQYLKARYNKDIKISENS